MQPAFPSIPPHVTAQSNKQGNAVFIQFAESMIPVRNKVGIRAFYQFVKGFFFCYHAVDLIYRTKLLFLWLRTCGIGNRYQKIFKENFLIRNTEKFLSREVFF
jgi:hypothetical protein